MSKLSDKDYKAIIARRDRRYDGRFYFGVKTTGIYCRPVCPAKPKPENIVILRSASEAEACGFRACLRCRPDAAPGSKLLDGTMNTVARALRIIQDAGEEELGVERLAAALGVTDRHLRRLFDEHLGASPVEIVITQRLHFARQILRETELPITEIAFAAGFKSVRRFNEAFKSRFQQTPSAQRRQHGEETTGSLRLKAHIRLPYDWEQVLAYLKRHEAYGVEMVEGGVYRRFVAQGRGFGGFVVARDDKQDFLSVTFENLPLKEVRHVLARVKILFDTDHNPVDVPAVARGIRVPASYDPFETAVSIILCQLVSTEAARTKLGTLIERFGQRLGTHGEQPVYAFPSPAVLANAKIEDIGLPRVKAGAIRALAAAVRDGAIDFTGDLADTTAKILDIRGIGPWTAAMIAMRCLGDPDAYPERDLIIARAAERQLADTAAWASSRAYLTHCLWRDYAESLSRAKGVKDELQQPNLSKPGRRPAPRRARR